jgi:hypothetical protein
VLSLQPDSASLGPKMLYVGVACKRDKAFAEGTLVVKQFPEGLFNFWTIPNPSVKFVTALKARSDRYAVKLFSLPQRSLYSL